MNTVICISRQFASGGHEIGEQLAKLYGIPFYDSEIITQSVKKTGLDENLIRSSDESATHSLIYSMAMGRYMNMGSPYIEAPGDKVFRVQTEVIKEFAEKGPCVIVGRCSGEILREQPNSRRIFIYADLDFRVKRAVEQYGFPLENIQELLQARDKERKAYNTRYTSSKWGATDSFDLAISSSRCGISGAVKTIAAYVESL